MREADRLKLALEKSHSAVYQWDLEKNEIVWTGDVHQFLGIDHDKPLDNLHDLCQIIHDHDVEKYTQSFNVTKQNGGDYQRFFQVRNDAGELVYVLDQGTVDISNNKRCMIGTFNMSSLVKYASINSKESQITSDILAFNKYETNAFRAKLTGVYNDDMVKGTQSILLKISIDNLPMVMTWYSIDYADRIMESLEAQIQHLIREHDIASRIALDQFGVILKNQSPSEAALVVDRILKTVQMYKNPSFEEVLHLRCSIGSVHFPKDAISPEDALNKAYLALTSARNKTDEFQCDYTEAREEHLNTRDEVEKLNYLQSSIAENRIHLAYQPIIATESGIATSYECLLRIQDDDGQFQSAGPLIPIAEKMGMIDVIDYFVMETIVEELKRSPDVTLGFNISNKTTNNPKWLKLFSKLLDDESVASRIIIEITETAAQNDMRQTAYFVAALQALGCKVALDDFGAGYTSFRQLKSLSVDIVKIDGAYVMGLEEKSDNLLFIKTLLDFNKSYGLITVAECVETGEVAKILMDLGVDRLQGWYFGKPEVERPWDVNPL